MKVTLPYPPSANRYWRSFRGRTVLSAEAKAYKKQVSAILSDAGWEPASGAVAYTAHIYRPLRSGDLDNRLKVLGDALTGFAWVDDKQVVELHAYRHDDKTNPRVEVEVTVLREDVATPGPAEVVEGCVVAGCSREARAGSPFCGHHNTPNRLRPKPKVKSAYRAAKEVASILPKKTHQDRLNEAGAVDLRDNMRMERLGGGYSRAVPIDPTKRHGAKEAQDVLPKKREHQPMSVGQAMLEAMRRPPPAERDEPDHVFAKKLLVPSRPSRGVEGELQPLRVKR